MCDDLHPSAPFFVQHPLRNHELIASRKHHLYLMRTERNGPAHHSYGLAMEQVMRIVNRQRNMGSVCAFCKSPMLKEWPGFARGMSLADS